MTKRIILTTLVFLSVTVFLGQTSMMETPIYRADNEDSTVNEQNAFTIYVIPSKVKYDWSSPRSLFKSYFKNIKRNLFKKDSYLLGHAFVELRTPLASRRIFTGMRSASRKEQKDMVLKQHYGLAILGADIKGKLETDAELERNVDKYSRKGQLAFMTFYLSDEATQRLIQYFDSYMNAIDSNGSRGARYGGAFWPRYKGEGAGCSAFAVSFLDLTGILKEEFDEWLVKINIPMELIGGPYNQDHDVRVGDIKKYQRWGGPDEPDIVAYEHFEIYDPTLMYEWIQDTWDEQNVSNTLPVTPVQLNQAKGIRIDGRNQALPAEESIFLERENPSIFIDYYHQKFTNGN